MLNQEPALLGPARVGLLTTAGEQQLESTPQLLLRLLYAQMRRLAGPRPDLDDLVQSAAERALKSWARYQGRSALSTWTWAVAYHVLLDHERWYRRWRRRFSYSEDVALPEAQCAHHGESIALQAERARRLQRALQSLPPAKRAVVVLHEFEGLSMREIASIVGANERTVRSRLHDAKQKLLALLRADPLFDPEVSP
jgi:RNA polymerase sigma-70 factor (ECF subfamily)